MIPAISVSENSTWRVSSNLQATFHCPLDDGFFDEGFAMLQWFRDGCKTRDGLEQRVKVAKQIAHQAVGHVPVKMRVAIDEFPKAELEIVKGVDQLPHGLDAFAHLQSILAEPGCGNVAGGEGGVDGVSCELAAAQCQEDSGRKDGVEKGKGVSHQYQSIGRAIAGTIGIFSRHTIRPGLSARRQVLLNPRVFRHLVMKDLGKIPRAVVKVRLLGNSTDTHDILRQRNVPEPALLREVSNSSGALIDSWVAQRSLVVGPDSDFVQVRIAHFPPTARHCERIAPTGVDRD